MKVVVNVGIGGFGLSNRAAELCIERGIPLRGPDDSHWNERGAALRRREILGEVRYDCDNRDEREFRSHPTVIGVVEELGAAANGEHAELAVLEIPFDKPFGWHVAESEEGREWINEDHRRWFWDGEATEETVS